MPLRSLSDPDQDFDKEVRPACWASVVPRVEESEKGPSARAQPRGAQQDTYGAGGAAESPPAKGRAARCHRPGQLSPAPPGLPDHDLSGCAAAGKWGVDGGRGPVRGRCECPPPGDGLSSKSLGQVAFSAAWSQASLQSPLSSPLSPCPLPPCPPAQRPGQAGQTSSEPRGAAGQGRHGGTEKQTPC